MIDLAPANPYTLTLATPLLAAAGALGYGVEYARHLGLSGAGHGLGALVTRSTSPRARRARPQPALAETPAGLLYRGAEQNPGLRALRDRIAPAWARWGLPVIVSVAGADALEAAEAAAGLEGIDGVRGVELPLALHGIAEPDPAARLVAAVRAATFLPLIVKLPGEAADLAALARAALDAGADALAAIDGLPGRLPDAEGGALEGRLYGPAIFPLALRAVARLRAAVDAPIIGMGGVRDAAGARAMLEAGASAVALGSALLADPRLASRIAAELAA